MLRHLILIHLFILDSNSMKNYIFAIIIILLLIPVSLYLFPLSPTQLLYGEVLTNDIDFIAPKWDSGEFQEKKEVYLNQHFGLRNWLIHAHNEFEYQVFGKLFKEEGQEKVGKEDYVFDQAYIREYTGKDFVGDSVVNVKIKKLKGLKDSLAKRNISLLMVFAPSKAHYYSEYLPENGNKRGEKINYDYFTNVCKQENIPYIDFNTYFRALKPKTPYPLFTKTGIHWSAYGAALAMDSIFKWIEQERKIDMPDFDWHELELSDTARGTDDDMIKVANIFTRIKNPTLAYPKLKFHEKPGQQKIKTLTISDSFWWDVFNSGAYQNIFQESILWYYFDNIYPVNNGQYPKKVNKFKIKPEIEKYNLVIIESTGSGLNRLGYGFIESAYERYISAEKEIDMDKFLAEKLDAYINQIKNDTEWMGKIHKIAADKNVTIDSIIRENALFILNQNQY